MRTNASKGIMLVFIASLLTFVCQSVIGVATFVDGSLLTVDNEFTLNTFMEKFFNASTLFIVSTTIAAIATVLNLIGLFIAGKDKSTTGYVPAFVFSIFLIISQIVTTLLTAYLPHFQETEISLVSTNLVKAIITVFVVQTTINLLINNGKRKTASFGKTTLIIYIIGTGLSVIMILFSKFLLYVEEAPSILVALSSILTITVAILLLPLCEVLYTIFLGLSFSKI